MKLKSKSFQFQDVPSTHNLNQPQVKSSIFFIIITLNVEYQSIFYIYIYIKRV